MDIPHAVVKTRLTRRIWLRDGESQIELYYNGWGIGYEDVRVNNIRMARKISHFWFTPRFEFYWGTEWIQIDVRVNILLEISAFEVRIDAALVYREP